MYIFKKTPQWDFLGKRKWAFLISGLLVLSSIIGLVTKGMTYGIDFNGGMLIQVQFQERPQLDVIRKLFQDKMKTSVNVTTFGNVEDNEVIITMSQEIVNGENSKLSDVVHQILDQRFKNYDIRRIETVGAKVGSSLRTKATEAALYVLIGILIYVGIRFKPRYGVASVIALFHDVLITLGVFVFTEKEFTLTILAAILTIIGYSLNDTIVVFDRVRENVARFPRKPIKEMLNLSVNETLSRTILTSFTTFLVVFCLWVLGGEIIHDFCLAMMVGLVVGTYSSIFVASPVVMYFSPERLAHNKPYQQLLRIAQDVKSTLTGRGRKKAK